MNETGLSSREFHLFLLRFLLLNLPFAGQESFPHWPYSVLHQVPPRRRQKSHVPGRNAEQEDHPVGFQEWRNRAGRFLKLIFYLSEYILSDSLALTLVLLLI